MKSNQNPICPRCNYPLVPVHARGDKERQVVALTCPEPYCDHIEVVTKGQAAHFQKTRENSEQERAIS